MNQEIVGRSVLDAAFKVHTKLGPGLGESVYEVVMTKELRKIGLVVERQKIIPVFYDGEPLEEVGFRADLIIDNLILIELKSVAVVSDSFHKTTRNYLRLISLKVGFLVNLMKFT